MTIPSAEIGSLLPVPGWNTLDTDAAMDPPALLFPQAVQTYSKMRVDPQIDSLCNSVSMPILRMKWEIDPNGARDEVVAQVSTDLGLPIVGAGDAPAPRSRRRFKHRDHLEHALLALWYGHMFFEMVPDTERFDLVTDGWRLRKLAPRMPGSIQRIHVAKDGGLEGISQVGYRPPTVSRRGLTLVGDSTPQIPVDALAAYVWKREGANWRGRSMLRPLYGSWLLKDRALRVDALKNERFGMGIPVGRAPEGGDPAQYAALAQAMRAAESGGAGLPAGADLGVEGIRGTLPDVLASIRYYDESMARAFMAMVIQLGQTQTGSRALGNTFADFFQMLTEAVADWYKDTTNEHVVEDLVDWNWGEDEQAPLLTWSYSEDEEPLAVSDLVQMVTNGVITMDAETEAFVRDASHLPQRTVDTSGVADAASSQFSSVGLPALVNSFILTPDEARQMLGMVGPAPAPPQIAAALAKLRPDLTSDQIGQATVMATSVMSVTKRKGVRKDTPKITVASAGGRRFEARKQTVSDPVVGHRNPNAIELAAKTNFEVLQEQWQAATGDLVDLWKTQVQAAQITALLEQVRSAVESGDTVALASLTAPVEGVDALKTAMAAMAEDALVGAKEEAAAQGVTIGTIDTAQAVDPVIASRAEATATLMARGIADSAARAAVNGGVVNLSADEAEAFVRDHLENLTDAYLNDMLGGAMTQAQNTGRRAVMQERPAQIYSSELLDQNTCVNCTAVDETEYSNLLDAEKDYPTGGYKECLGGPRCRGTLVAVYDEASPS